MVVDQWGWLTYLNNAGFFWVGKDFAKSFGVVRYCTRSKGKLDGKLVQGIDPTSKFRGAIGAKSHALFFFLHLSVYSLIHWSLPYCFILTSLVAP